MFPHSNVHTHTVFSDGKSTAEETVLKALDRGFISLGFSDHGYVPWDAASMPEATEPLYRAEIRRLQALYADRIELALGYEHDASRPEADLSPYDYVIESVHFFTVDGLHIPVDESADCQERALREHFGGDPLAMTGHYFRAVSEALTRTDAVIAGHLDLVSKYCEKKPLFDPEDPRYIAQALEAASVAVGRDMLVEINTGAISRGYRSTPYPAVPILEYIREKGGRITITSDCHNADWLDTAFDRACGLARACGFTETWVLKGGAFAPVAL